jgi:peptidoglycan/xylan/chitin deacetylase (PgdA/CDA1 family)
MGIYFKIKRAVASLLIQKKVDLNLSEAVISFTFDDAPNSAFTTGAGILKKYGYNGTYYVALGLLDRPEGPYFDYTHLKRIKNEGGEVACHTFNHIHLYTSGKSKITADLEQNEKRIKELIPGHKFANFSYPYGEQTFTSKRILRNRYKSARSVKSGINSGKPDLINLKAVELNDALKLDDVFSIVEEAIQQKGWLIFYTHDVEENYTPIGCSTAYFEQVVAYCAKKNIRVLTIEKVLEKVEQPK